MIKIGILGYNKKELEFRLKRQPKRFPITFTVVGTMKNKVHWDVIRMAAKKAATDLLNEPLPYSVKALMPTQGEKEVKITVWK